jgi:hypothetical protein
VLPGNHTANDARLRQTLMVSRVDDGDSAHLWGSRYV